MPPASFIASSSVVSSRTSTVTLLTPVATQPGDLLVAFGWSGETLDSNLTTSLAALPPGWSLLSRVDTPTRQLAALLCRVATDTEPPSHTFHQTARGTGFPLVMGLVVYRGLDPGTPLVTVSVQDVTTSTASFPCPGLSLTTYSDVYLGFVADHDAATMTVPATATKQLDQRATTDGGVHLGAFDAHFEATGPTGTQTATLSVASTGVAVAYALKSLPPQPAPAITPDLPGAIGFVTVGV